MVELAEKSPPAGGSGEQSELYRYITPPSIPIPEDFAEARKRMREAVARLGKGDWIVDLELGDGRYSHVDCRSRSCTESDMPAATKDCSLTLSPQTLLQILSGQMDCRYAMLFQRMSVSGSVSAATLFCDAMAGQVVRNSLPGSSPYSGPADSYREAKAQLREFGYTVIPGALDEQQLLRVRRRLIEQEEAEREQGLAFLESGLPGSETQPNQRVWNLPNKGQEFIDLLDHPIVDEFMPEFLGDYYLLANHHANVAGPGGKPMYLHNDQINIQPPIPDFPVGLNLVWFLDDVTAENGGTRIIPGSHRPGIKPDNVFSTEGTIAAEGPAGAAFIFDSRLWHGTGSNTTDRKRHIIITYFVRCWVRMYENATISLREDVLQSLSPRLKTMFGFRITSAQGSVEGQGDEKEGTFIDRNASTIPLLRPSMPLPEEIYRPVLRK